MGEVDVGADAKDRDMATRGTTIMTLDEWQKVVLPFLREERFVKASLGNVTLLAYFFWDDDRIETKFYTVECAFLCAYKSWGMLPSVLVVNRETQRIKTFCSKYGIELQVDPSLTGGVPTMNLDCIRSLYRRFATEYVVIIQSDGIPVNPGLENFIGTYDYVGAPWPGHCHLKDWFPYPKYGVGNGGFCLRSKRICEQAARSYNAFWRYLPYNWLVGDDVFYCKTMPFLSRYWRREFRFPTVTEAIKFSIEAIPPGIAIDIPPLGFHSDHGFFQYVKHFGVPFADIVRAK